MHAGSAMGNASDKAARVEGEVVIQRWNEQLALGRDMLWSPTIRAALFAGTPWLDVFCPGRGTSKAIDLRIDRLGLFTQPDQTRQPMLRAGGEPA
jgi:hypothetical protein